MLDDADLRVCRVLSAYPSDESPGGGLPAYYLSLHAELPTLHVARKTAATNHWALPRNIDVRFLSYPEAFLGDKRGPARLAPLATKLVGQVLFSAQALVLAKRFGARIVHVHTLGSLLFAVLAKWALRTPVVLTFHGTDFVRLKQSPWITFALRRLDRICYVSPHMKPALEEILGQSRVHYTPNGVDLNTFRYEERPREPVVLMIGSLKWQKRVADGITAFADLATRRPELSLAVIGDGPERSELEALAETLGLGSRVLFMGTRSREDVAAMLNRARVLLLTSSTEGMPKVVLEALACGTPVVATEVGACPELLADGGGTVVPVGDIEAIATAVDALLSDRAHWEMCSSAARETAAQYTWAATATGVVELYKDVLAEQHART